MFLIVCENKASVLGEDNVRVMEEDKGAIFPGARS